jgi:hypothetical protein
VSQEYLYLNLNNAVTGQINGIVTTNSLESVVESNTMVRISPALVSKVDWSNIYRTHYFQKGQLISYPIAPEGAYTFDFESKEWKLDVDLAWSLVRRDRDQLLNVSDWRVTRAVETNVPMSGEWIAYRQALREVTNQSDPTNIVWPVAPI